MTDWNGIVAREGPLVLRTVRRLLGGGGGGDVEECFQETFLAAVTIARRQPVRNWGPLLQRVATARAIDRLRQRQRERRRGGTSSDAVSSVPSPAPLPLDEAAARELAQRLREALAELPPAQAEVFCLNCLQGWSYADIAAAHGTTVDAVGVTLHRARRRLRELLKTTTQLHRDEVQR